MKHKGPLKEPLDVDLTFARRAMTAAERDAPFSTGRKRGAVDPAAIAELLEQVRKKRSVFKGGASDRQPPDKPGVIREQEGLDVDFIGGGPPPTEAEWAEISAAIRKHREASAAYAQPVDPALASEPTAVYKRKRSPGAKPKKG